jgi:hypothetical protein
MSKAALLSFVSVSFAMAVGLTGQVASALPCCSVCAQHPFACRNGCTPTCRADDKPALAGHVVYDEVAAVCYVAE